VVDNAFGQALRRARLDAGYSQECLGRQVYPDISLDSAKQRIYRIEKDEDSPTSEDMERIRRYLKFDIDIVDTDLRSKTWRREGQCLESWPCKGRGEMFQPRSRRQKYCTSKCRQQYWWNKQNSPDGLITERRGTKQCCKRIEYKRPDEDEVLHAGHLRQMPPEKLSRMLNDVLNGKRGYVKGHK
jgi:transcriptional regulator with XRE-family HTH domain